MSFNKLLGLLLLLLLVPVRSFASCSNTNISNGWTCVISTSGQFGTNGGSTTGVNSTGGTLLLFTAGDYTGGTQCTVSDTINGGASGNTWTQIRTITGSIIRSGLWYVNSATPAVGTNHVVTCTATGNFSSGAFFVFKNPVVPFDMQNAAGNGASATLQPGSITPSNPNSLIVTTLAAGNTMATINSINSSFVLAETVQPVSGGVQGVGFAYLTQSTAAAVNPTWTLSAGADVASIIVSFSRGLAVTGGGNWVMMGIK